MEEKINSSQTNQVKEEVKPDFKYLIARKLGMTQIFNEKGELKGVTVLEAGPCEVVYLRTKEKDGYNAVCLGFEEKKKNINKPLEGIFKKYNVLPKEYLKEFRFDNIDGIKPGQIVTLSGRFKEGEWVDVEGITIGKGFAGAMKRHNFSGQPASHGASDRERAPGSLASRRALGRVIPGKRMAGHLGCERVTIQKIKVIKVIPEKNIIMVNGSVPGKPGSIVYIKKTSKTIKEPKVTTVVKSQTKKEAAKQAKKK
ncbi:MAG: 50S ribosomal protein L3 [Elusimicrobiales bacterium]|nr:50S ribosomal protein L3 [Elusimicrobiales bacterium]